MPIRRVDIKRANDDHEGHDREFHDYDSGIYTRTFADPLHQNRRDDQSDGNRGKVEPGPRQSEMSRRQIVIKRRVGKVLGQSDVEEAEKILKVMGPAVRYRRGSNRVLKNQIPTHDPRE